MLDQEVMILSPSQQECQAVLDMARLVEKALDLESVLEGILQRLDQALDLRGARFWLWETGDAPWVATGLGQDQDLGPDAVNQTLVIGVPLLPLGRESGRLVAALRESKPDPGSARRLVNAAAQLASSVLALHRDLSLRRHSGENAGNLDPAATHLFLPGQSEAMVRAQELLSKSAPSEATVLLLGPLGVGKALAAQVIHRLSQRRGGPLLHLDCSAWGPAELERRLFGRAAGSGSPADSLLEQASGGTLYLQEVSSLSLPLQAKLLQVLQEGEYEPAGGGEIRRAQVRVVASSTQDLERNVAQGSFRQDLLYRLGVMPIHLPSLRQRRSDVSLLAEYFLACNRDFQAPRLSSQAQSVLTHYAWPGNVAELENLCGRLALLTNTPEIGLDDLPSFLFYREAAGTQEQQLSRLEEIEKQEVVAALERNNWVQSHAATELGLTLRQIGYRVKKFGLESAIKKGRNRTQDASL
ncbi:MAG: sigma 54-interacting transcriptional regulator [Desulfarculaceae bacterium]|nr:sigma 54-interacting transcriptional regulator [Desulfarculaceae bacterium]MCF8048552.1 sigma 54-interacting transcriptional regulator [Desulfarculaceae bacterium]MCF8124180.1 sigma 54-interacting transcriptional regulator [Desulfarculaceae bacterium]